MRAEPGIAAAARAPAPAVRVTRRFGASPARVFAAWLDPRTAGGWLFATATRPMTSVALEPRVGGAFRFVERGRDEETAYAGTYTEIVAPRRLGFTLAVADRPTRVTVEIAPRPGGCELVLTHEDVPAEHAAHCADRWTGILYGLAETLARYPA